MITIDLLKNHPDCIQTLSSIWCNVLGKKWITDVSIEECVDGYCKELLNDGSLPLTFVALEENQLVGSCSLLANDDIIPELTPWLGDLIVDTAYQGRGIGKILIETAKKKAKELGFKKLYLFAFNPMLPEYYAAQGWKAIERNEFKGHAVTVMEVCL